MRRRIQIHRSPRRKSSPVLRRVFQPAVSQLEDRTLLATMTWTNAAGGDWDVASNWVNASNPADQHVPTASDDAVINISGVTVTHSASATDSVNSLTLSSSQSDLNISNGSLAVTVSSSIAGNLTVSGGTLSTASSLTVGGSTTWTGGTISGGGTLNIPAGASMTLGGGGTETLDGVALDNYGTDTWTGGIVAGANGSTFNNEAGSTFDLEILPGPCCYTGLQDITLNNYGTVNWSSGNVGTGNGTINNEAGATFNAETDGQFVGDAFNNLAGATFNVANDGVIGPRMALVFNNAGMVNVNSGGLTLGYFYVSGAAVSSGAFYGAPGTGLGFLVAQDFTPTSSINAPDVGFNGFNGGVYDVEGSYAVSGRTVLDVGAHVNFTGTVSSVGTSFDIIPFNNNASANFSPTTPVTLTTSECTITGTLTGSDSFIVTGPLTLNGAALSTTGTIDAEGGLAVTGGSLDYCTLNNYGTATWSGTNGLLAGHGATVNNEPGATFAAQTDSSFDWNGAGAVPTFNNIAGATFTKSGGTGASGTQLGLVFNNAGTVSVQSGTLAFGESSVTATASSTGSFQGAPGTTLNFLSAQNFASTSNINADTVAFYTSGYTYNEAGTYSASSATVIRGGQVNFTGTVTSVGNALDIFDVANFIPAVFATLTTNECTINNAYLEGVDNLVVSGMLTLSGAFGLVTSGRVDARGGLAITGGGLNGFGANLDTVTLNNYGAATWSGTNGVFAGHGATFNNEPGATFAAQTDSSFDWNGVGAVPTFNNIAGATFTKSGGTGASGTQLGLVFNNAGTVSVQSGTLQLGGNFAGGQPILNSGTVTIGYGTTLAAVSDYDQTAGSTTLSGGTFSGGNLNIQGGVLSGSGTINANVTNAGQVIPGGIGAAGVLTVNGTYTQTATGGLDIELGGTSPGSQYDQLAVSRTASLSGTLNVATINAFQPAFGNSFQVLTFGSSSGNFATYNAPSLASGLFLDSVFSPSSGPTSMTVDIDRVAIGGAPAFPVEGVPINLTATVTGPSAGSSFSFSWTVTQNSNSFAFGTGSTVSFTPNLNATYVVTLTVSDVAGGKGTTSLQLIVAPSIFVLNASASGALTVSGNASINIPGQIVVDSSSSSALSASGNAQVTATVIDVAGGFNKSGNATFNPAPTTGVSVADPLAALAAPSPTGLTNYCSVSFTSGTHTINPGIYSSIKVSGNASLTMSAGSGGTPGIYIIEGGGLTVTGNASVSGQNVFIYNTGSNYPNSGGNFGGITLSGNGTIALTAPASGPYAGVAIFQSRANTRAVSFSGNAMSGISGIIYAPNALLSFSGNSQLQSALDVGMLNLSGNVTLTETAAGSDGSGDVSGIANTLLAGDLSVYINDPSGLFTADELSRIQDAINAWDRTT
jgi:hypothetical protein